MVRVLTLTVGVFALGVLAAAAAPAATDEPVPMRQRGLVYTVGPQLPRPEEAALGDPRFLAAARYTTARQLSAVAAALLVVASLAALWLSGGASRVVALAGERPFAKSLLAAATVGVVVAVWSLGAALARTLALGAAAGAPGATAIITKTVCYGVAAFALAFAAAATRGCWPRTWWLALTFAAVAAAVGSSLLDNPRRLSATAPPPTSFLAERAAYLAARYEMPPYEVFVERRGAAGGLIRARATPHRGAFVVTAGADALGRYETEVLLAGAITRAQANRRAPLAAATLIIFMASLLVADAVVAALSRRRGRKPDEPAALPLLAAAFIACWLLSLPVLHSWNRHLLLGADAAAVRTTRKPINAVSLYYKEAAANMVAAEPNAILHFLVDGAPSPAERAVLARRLRLELAK